MPRLELASLVERLTSLLLRPPSRQTTKAGSEQAGLVARLMGQVSITGEDILLQLGTDLPARYHRLRASIPSKLWRWKDVAGWRRTGDVEHINALELRAFKTAIVWRLKELEEGECRFLHLIDSLVVLRALSRGRSSNRRLRRTLCRIGALQLAGGLVGVWGYVDTHQNPADRPSRPPSKKMGKKATKVMEGKSQQERKKVRSKLGSLKGLTVQPRTRQRYTDCLNRFFDWMAGEGLVLPKRRAQLDTLVSDYLENLWASGEGKSIANNTLAALQDRDPSLEKKLPGSWRLLKAWTTIEIPNRAPPMTLQVLTKGGARQGAAESVTLHERSILPALWKWKQSNQCPLQVFNSEATCLESSFH